MVRHDYMAKNHRGGNHRLIPLGRMDVSLRHARGDARWRGFRSDRLRLRSMDRQRTLSPPYISTRTQGAVGDESRQLTSSLSPTSWRSYAAVTYMDNPEGSLGLPLSLLGSIGLFVAVYGHLEHMVHMVSYHYIGLNEESGRALIAGMRLGDVMASTKRLVIAQKLDQRIYDDLNLLFDEVSALSTFRDKVIHRQWGKGPHGTVLTNLVSAKSSASIDQDPITTADLATKVGACATLGMRLMSHLVTRELWLNLDSMQFDPKLRNLLRCPWFDKPGPPATPYQQPPKAPR